jgi:hypothetical protein
MSTDNDVPGTDWWTLSLWILGFILRVLHLAGSLFALTTAFVFIRELQLGLIFGLSVLTWIGWVSYVSHNQLRFTWAVLVIRWCSDKTEDK